MYDIAAGVAERLSSGTQVNLAWVIEARGFSSRGSAEVLAVTSDGQRLGTIASGTLDVALHGLLADLVAGRAVELSVSDADAAGAGLSCGGSARCLLMPAGDLPDGLWDLLVRREPAFLVTRIEGSVIGATSMFTPETVAEAGADIARVCGRGVSQTAVLGDLALSALWPTPRLVIVGAGLIADALHAVADLLGWSAQMVSSADVAAATIGSLCPVDAVVVLSHDRDVDGPALTAALDSRAGYVGALGSRRTQQARAEWLATRGITDLTRVHGPAGLAIGANTPAEIAIAIVAEMLAARSGMVASSLRDRSGPIHHGELQEPWPHSR